MKFVPLPIQFDAFFTFSRNFWFPSFWRGQISLEHCVYANSFAFQSQFKKDYFPRALQYFVNKRFKCILSIPINIGGPFYTLAQLIFEYQRR